MSFLSMSVYDPFRLYAHHQKKSHDGQVIRKKLIPPQNYAISEEMLKQAQEILIKAGIRGFNSSLPQRLFIFKNYPNIEHTNLSIVSGDSNLSLQFSGFWDVIKNDFASIYNNVDPLSVKNIEFTIQLNSFIFGPQVQTIGSTANLTFHFTFDGFSKEWTIPCLSGRMCVGCISYTTQQCFVEIQAPHNASDTTILSTKDTETTHPYLSSVTNNSPAILTALKNSDYTVFNPQLLLTSFNNASTSPFIISNVIYNLTVGLAVEYS